MNSRKANTSPNRFTVEMPTREDGVYGLTSNTITPPGPERDRTGPERDRYKERLRGKIKKPSDIISKVPIITKPGTIKVPVDGGREPIWRPGRDGQGGAGGPGPGEPGSDPGDYVEMSWEEFVKMIFDELDLPNMLKKQIATTLVKTQKVKGISRHGPKARLNKRATAKARIKRAASLRNAQPELFVGDFASKCQAVFDAYVFAAAIVAQGNKIFPAEMMPLVGDNAEDFLRKLETIDPFPKVVNGRIEPYRKGVLNAVEKYLTDNPSRESASYKCHGDLARRIEVFVYEEERAGRLIPTIEEVPFHKNDLRYNRLQDKYDPDSKAVVFLVVDRSGSMQGDPLDLCKMYFFLCVMFLRTRYKTVDIVLISHDAQAYLWKNEQEFFNIGAGGGTVAVPAWKLVHDIAETGAKSETTGNAAGPYPAKVWNRYMFHGTDGDLFDGEFEIQKWWKKIILEDGFNYCGYLECGTSWGGFGSAWRAGGRALRGLPAEAKERLGMARANRKDDVIQAFKDILTKNANMGGN